MTSATALGFQMQHPGLGLRRTLRELPRHDDGRWLPQIRGGQSDSGRDNNKMFTGYFVGRASKIEPYIRR